MIKILHSADWHLDSPLQLQNPETGRKLRQILLEIPGKIAALCKDKQCDLALLSGDLFDGTYTQESLRALKSALEDISVPVFIAPGNHDFAGSSSPWLQEQFPENVHIFTHPAIEYKDIPKLNCRVYGAGFSAMDCPALLEGFHVHNSMAYNIGVFHGDPTQVNSPYNPITTTQVAQSGLDYLALGHIHKADSFQAGSTLCAWPGCPMGRGYDEQGDKGALVVTLDNSATAEFIPLDTPRFYDWEVSPELLASVLPPVGNEDLYRITLTGQSDALDLDKLTAAFSRFPNLVLRDKTVPPVDVWSDVGEDTFRGMYFKLLQEALEDADEDTKRQIHLAAKLSRQLLDGQEVVLP